MRAWFVAAVAAAALWYGASARADDTIYRSVQLVMACVNPAATCALGNPNDPRRYA